MPTYFLIVSLGRCGSTLLSQSLNQCDGVFCDYELVNRDSDKLRAGHISIALQESSFSFRHALSQLCSENAVVGSKLSVPRYQWASHSFWKQVVGKLAIENIKIVHLSRSLIEHFVSRKVVNATGIWHIRTNSGFMEEAKNRETYELPNFSVSEEDIDTFCHDALIAERYIISLKRSLPYLFVDYADLTHEGNEILSFLGTSISSNNKGNGLFETTGIQKTIRIPHADLITNFDAIEMRFLTWERKREQLLFNLKQ